MLLCLCSQQTGLHKGQFVHQISQPSKPSFKDPLWKPKQLSDLHPPAAPREPGSRQWPDKGMFYFIPKALGTIVNFFVRAGKGARDWMQQARVLVVDPVGVYA